MPRTKTIEFAEVEVGKQYKIVGSGYMPGVYAYEQGCAKDGDTFVVTSRRTTSINTTAGPIVNMLAKFIQVQTRVPVKDSLRTVEAGTGPMLGTDPEFFIVRGDGTVFPAWEFLPKQIKNQEAMEFWDGFQGEMTVRPESCIAWLVDHVQVGLYRAIQKAKAVDATARLNPVGVIDVPYEVMQSAAPEHTELGCAPSVNAYGDMPLIVDSPRELPIRFAGFHVHASTKGYGMKDVDQMIRVIDEVYGLPSIALLAGLDDERRRQFYGKAGEYREPPYGIEYRVPSGANLRHPVLAHVTFNMVRTGIKVANRGITDIWDIGQEEVRRIINQNDVESARNVLTAKQDVLDLLLHRVYHNGSNNNAKLKRLIMEGAAKFLPDLDDPERAWKMRSGQHWATHSDGRDESIIQLQIEV